MAMAWLRSQYTVSNRGKSSFFLWEEEGEEEERS